MTAVDGARPQRLAPPLSARNALQALFVIGTAVAFVWAWNRLNMSLLAFFDDLSNVANLFRRMYPPDFSDMDRIIRTMAETLWIALLGTVGATILSYPLAIGAASNTTRHPTVRYVCRSIITFSRAVPELILAAIFVAAVGPGPYAGVLALSLHSVGMIGRLFADAIEQAEEAPREASMSAGATRRQSIRSSVIPQALPSMIATALFRLEINIRGSAVLGLVGAGGIGQVISESLETIQYKPALAAVAVVFVVIMVVEVLSTAVRSSLIGEAAAMQQNKSRSFLARMNARRDERVNRSTSRGTTVPPWTGERLFRLSSAVFGLCLVLYSFLNIDIDWWKSITNMGHSTVVLRQLFPPSFGDERSLLISGLVESVAISVVATVLGVIVAIPLGILVARNVNRSRVVSTLMRLFILAVRGIPELIIAVIFVSAMGLGPVPGTLALSVTVAVFAAKLFADSLEEVSPAPREAVLSVGATRRQELVSAVLPQFLSPFVSHFFYLLDVYFRSSTVLGIVGGGGIGYLLIQSIRVFQFRITCTIVIAIYVIVMVFEWVGNGVRRLYR